MSSRRKGRGQSISQKDWPASGAWRDWLVFCDKIHKDNDRPSLRKLAEAMNLRSPDRIRKMLCGLSLPADRRQAEDLLEALGAVGREVAQGVRLYEAARAEQAGDARNADQPGWWLRSGYLDQVGGLAPLQLLDRGDELAELADWCTGGDEAYVWWQAGPGAGKSALMAWFVLHPPPDVWVVSFFVTARLAGQADSGAFTDRLLDQLAGITGDMLPPVASASARDLLRRQLLADATARAVKAGRRLVLVVDGFEEDYGSASGSRLRSIAACLPKRPPDGLRVIVAGRPDPPIPADVDNDHPLRKCRIRQLDVSPHATRVTERAKQELYEVLATDRDRHDGLGYQVLGLVTASGGGLDDRDLQQLTGRPAFALDRLLRDVFGRTIVGRGAPHATERMFLFAHETLRVQAIDSLGPYTLAEFTDRLNRWATGYRRRGWPDDTPGYLLRGYPRMLADAGDHDRLVALASDPDRHQRMLDVTGGDAAALAEITMTQDLLLACPEPDLLALARLSMHRQRLESRHLNMPTGLPAVWVLLGEPARAEALARGIPTPHEQVQALAKLAQAMAADGMTHDARRAATEAEHLAADITDPEERAWARADLIRAFAATGQPEQTQQLAATAEHVVAEITDPEGQALALATLIRAVAAADQLELAQQLATDAGRIASRFTESGKQATALADLVEAVAAAGAVDQAERLARDITDEYTRAWALTQVAQAAARNGDPESARRLATEIQQLARGIAERDRQASVLVNLAEAWAAAGDATSAEQVAGSIPAPHQQVRALAKVAHAMFAAGDLDEARRFATEAETMAAIVTNSRDRAHALADLIRALAVAGWFDKAEQLVRDLGHWRADMLVELAHAGAAASDLNRARRLAIEAEGLARTDTDDDERWLAQATVAVVEALATAGRGEHAGQVAADAERRARDTNPRYQPRLLAGLARAMTVAGDFDWAERLARDVTVPYEQARALAGLAQAMAAAGDLDRAERLVHGITDPDERGPALVQLIRTFAAAGKLDRARQLATGTEQQTRDATAVYWKARGFAELSQAVTAVGDFEWAERLIRNVKDPYWQVSAVADLVKAIAADEPTEARRLAGEAEQVTRRLTDPYWRVPALAKLIKAVVATGDFEWAERLARDTTDPYRLACALTELARAVAAAGELTWARRLAAEAEQHVQHIAEQGQRAWASVDVAGAVAAAGDLEGTQQLVAEVEQAARALANPHEQVLVLTKAAEVVASPLADRLLGVAFRFGSWLIPLPALAKRRPELMTGVADEFAQLMAKVAHNTTI